MSCILKILSIILIYLTVAEPSIAKNPIVLRKSMANIGTDTSVLIYYDRYSLLDFGSAMEKLSNNKFQPYREKDVPHKFLKGQYTNWIYFKVVNNTVNEYPLLINSYLINDSIWLLLKDSIIYCKIGTHYPYEYDEGGVLNFRQVNSTILQIPPQNVFGILIKNYDDGYSTKLNIPVLFDAFSFEEYYFDKTFYLSFAFLASVFIQFTYFVFFSFQAIITRDKVIIWYSLFLLISTIISWRNLEAINPNYISSINILSWNQAKLIHSVIVFYAYIKFITSFLNNKPPIIIKFYKATMLIIVCCLTIEIGLVLFGNNIYYKYLNYYFLRSSLTMIGVFVLPVIWFSKTKYSRFIFLGISFMVIAEIIGWFLKGISSNFISLIGTFLELTTFSLVLAIRNNDNLILNNVLHDQNQKLEIEKLNMGNQIQTKISRNLHDDLGVGLTSLKFIANAGKPNLSRMIAIVDDLNDNLANSIWSLNPANDKLTDFIIDIRKYSKQYCEDHKIDFVFQTNIEKNCKNLIDGSIRRNLLLCIKEALNNSLKHSNASKFSIDISLRNDEIVLILADNGSSSMDKKEVLFSGNGLNNINKRVEEMDGTIIVENTNGFIVTLQIKITD